MRRVGERRRVTLSGASLCYGNFSALAKGVTLFWACWLMAGLKFADMAYFVGTVASITTDVGQEIHTIEFPNILRAFLAYNAGVKLVDTVGIVVHSERLLYNA